SRPDRGLLRHASVVGRRLVDRTTRSYTSSRTVLGVFEAGGSPGAAPIWAHRGCPDGIGRGITSPSFRVRARSEKMQRHVLLTSDHPTIVRAWRDVEEGSGLQRVDFSALHCRSGPSRDHKADMLHAAERRAGHGAHVLRPFPTRLIGSAPYCHPSDVHYFELAFGE